MASIAETQVTLATIASAMGVPIDLVTRIARQESGFRQDAISSAGAIGIMQLMPATAAGLGVNPYNAMENMKGGVTYLRQLYDKYGDWKLATAAYNAGPSRIDRVLEGKSSLPAETRGYLNNIWGSSNLYDGSTSPVNTALTLLDTGNDEDEGNSVLNFIYNPLQIAGGSFSSLASLSDTGNSTILWLIGAVVGIVVLKKVIS